MSFSGKSTGAAGEDLAADFLFKKGYQVLRRNYVTKVGEIDIIAQDRETVVFVEVKAFADNSWEGVSPVVNVTPGKQKKIIRVARQYIASLEWEPYCRFDVVAVRTAPELFVEHFEGAFTE
jgi:putative endonuclease